jgi:hypothetical protein
MVVRVVKVLCIVFLLPSFSHAGHLISSMTWTEDGGYKMAQQDSLPFVGGIFCSTCTISRAWDGTTIKLFGAKGELLTWVTYLIGGASNATNVMVAISSFTGTGSAVGSGFSAVAVSSSNVWDYTTRPYSIYKYSYLQQLGINKEGAGWDPTEYEERQLPLRWRVPCTVNGNNDCLPNGGTQLFSVRADANKFYPDPAVPIEEFAISSFTVFASSSQAIGGEVYISTSLPAGTYTATLTVTEGVAISTTIPINLLVYNVTLPPVSSMPVIADVGFSDLDVRLTGNPFPASENVDPYLTNHKRVAAFLHRKKVIMMGMPNVPGQDFPDSEWQGHIDGTGFIESNGLSPNTGPGYGVGDKVLVVGAYGSWQSASWSTQTVSGVSGYCTNVSSWTFYCTNNNLRCELYTPLDETSNANLAGEIQTLAVWSTTAPACASGGHTLPFFQTANLNNALANAPNVSDVASTSWIGPNTTGSSATWVTNETFYQQSSTHAVWGYNSGVGVDSVLPTQEAGVGPREAMWGAYKTNQSGWFLWKINYWTDSNNGGQSQNGFNADTNNRNNLYVNSKTFGYDIYPTTSPILGHTGFNFASDGVMLYPSTDTVTTGFQPVYGFNGVIGSWKLNMLSRGIQDVDIIKLAFARNPSQTTTLVNNLIQDVMYLRQCFTLADCTYVYGDRPWSENRDLYETTRETLLQIAAGVAFVVPSETINGQCRITGNVLLR